MLNASIKKPITGERKAYFEDLRINHVPQFLFRTWSSQSGGGSKLATNSVNEVVPHGVMKKSQGRQFYDIPESELHKMVDSHYRQRHYPFSEFSSWSSSLHLALWYAKDIGEKQDSHVAVIDTKQLDSDVLIWHVPHLYEQNGIHEYMAHGPIRGRGYMAVSYNTLESAGLLQVFPELLTLETGTDSWGQTLRRKMFDQRPMPLAMDGMEQPDETKQIQKIADLYGHLSLPVATALVCIRPRPWVHSRPRGKTALDDVAKHFANAQLPKGLSKGNWLRKGVVITEDRAHVMSFPDVRQWIELLQAICECANQSAKKLEQPKKKNSKEFLVEDVPATKQSRKKRPRGEEEGDKKEAGDHWRLRLRPRKEISYIE